MNYQPIIFDMDGTLLDTTQGLMVAIQKGLSGFQLKKELKPEQFAAEWGGDLVAMLIDFVLEHSERVLTRQMVNNELLRHYDRAIWDAYVKPFDGVVSLLQALKAHNIPLWVFSNSPDTIASALIEHFFPNTFAHVIGLSAQVKKPDATAIRHLFAQQHINPAHALLVGDTLTDCQTAKNGGTSFAAAVWDKSPQVNLLIAHEPQFVVETPFALQSLILAP
ncbi:MAG: HAD-IA family hydrolase [Ruthenibacterium sp.]